MCCLTRGWCGRRFFLGTRFGAKQASNRGIGLLGFGVLALYTASRLNCSLTRGKMWHNRFICNLHKTVSTSKWHFFFLLHPAVLYPAGFLLLNGILFLSSVSCCSESYWGVWRSRGQRIHSVLDGSRTTSLTRLMICAHRNISEVTGEDIAI